MCPLNARYDWSAVCGCRAMTYLFWFMPRDEVCNFLEQKDNEIRISLPASRTPYNRVNVSNRSIGFYVLAHIFVYLFVQLVWKWIFCFLGHRTNIESIGFYVQMNAHDSLCILFSFVCKELKFWKKWKPTEVGKLENFLIWVQMLIKFRCNAALNIRRMNKLFKK